MQALTYDTLAQGCTAGGPSVLTVTTELAPASGPHGGIAPARFVRGSSATYAFETRYIDGGDGLTPQRVVVVDSKGSSGNRVEAALSTAIRDGHPLLSLTPRIRLTYEGLDPVTCLELPHRAYDGHIRAGTVDGKPVTDHPVYRAARDVTAADARALLELSAAGLVLGVWDSTRRSHQVRFRSALVGETIGVLADQSEAGRRIDPRGGARVDTIAPSVRLSAKDMEAVLAAQEAELSPGNIEKITAAIKKAKSGTTSAAALGLGAIPPSLDGLGLVACSRIIRSHVLSFSALRQLRFGLGVDGDRDVRALLAALAINGLIRSYAELVYRANCDLRETGAPQLLVDGRNGDVTPWALPSQDEADAILDTAIQRARQAGVRWDGQVFEVTGNPLVAGGIEAHDDED